MWTFGRRRAPSSEFRIAAKTFAGRATLAALVCLAWPLAALAVDSDGDGLEDADETGVHGTNPALYDTDADGVSDGDEVLHYPTDPLDEDSDDDGLKDGEERLSASGFGPPRSVPIPTGAQHHVLDMNADGLEDVAWSTNEEAGFALNTAGGGAVTFSAPQIISSKQAYSLVGEPGVAHRFLDFDHDGDPDLLRFEYWPEDPPETTIEFRYYENRLDEPSADFAPAAVAPIRVLPSELHDLDGDGDLDFVDTGMYDFVWLRRVSDPALPVMQLGESLLAGWGGCLAGTWGPTARSPTSTRMATWMSS